MTFKSFLFKGKYLKTSPQVIFQDHGVQMVNELLKCRLIFCMLHIYSKLSLLF